MKCRRQVIVRASQSELTRFHQTEVEITPACLRIDLSIFQKVITYSHVSSKLSINRIQACPVSTLGTALHSPHPTRPTNMAAPPTTDQVASNGNMVETTLPTINGMATETTYVAPGLSADDFALYDRQIRLWGAQAQERIRNAHILLVSLRALGTEIAKNLTLAGISSLTIVDDEPVTEEDLGSCYFLRDEDIGKSVCAAQLVK